MQEFRDDDQGFIRWKESHLEGFVLNSARKPRADYLMLHRATCGHLTWRNDNVRWTKDYIKICSTEVDDLATWAQQHVTENPQLKPCNSCKPLSSLSNP